MTLKGDNLTNMFLETMEEINKTWIPGGYELLFEVNPLAYKHILKHFELVEDAWGSAVRGAVTDMYYLKALNALAVACSEATVFIGGIDEPAPF